MKVTVYPTEAVHDEIVTLGKKLGGKTKTDCFRLLLNLGVETARRSALKPDRLETSTLETHDMAVSALAYLMEMATHLDMPITKEALEERKATIINRIKRRT
jgi:hypothetical protein